MRTHFIFLIISLLFSSSLFATHDELISNLIASKSTIDKHAEMVSQSIKENRPLSGAELQEINEATQERLLLRDQAYEFLTGSYYLVQKKIKKDYTIQDHELKEMILALSVAVTLYDTTLYAFYKFHHSPKLRRLLNEKDSAYRREGNTFEKSIQGIFSFRNSILLQRAFRIHERFYIEEGRLNDEESVAKANGIIEASFVFKKLQNRKSKGIIRDFFIIIAAKIKIDIQSQSDFFNHLANSVLYNGSRLFGNIVGRIQKRRGMLYKDPKFLSRVTNALKSMDILLEKTPFRLTDNFIPGFWGHAAIYIGSQEELEEIGIWDHELVQQYMKEISKGRLIVEALRDKVQLNTLEHFSDIDDFAVLRMTVEFTNEEKAEHILRALSHVGKKYDFSFDVETGDTIVCSELHYRTFINVLFRTTTYLGRSTISVDQVAEQGKTGMPFQPIMMYLNGKEVNTETIQKTFDAVLEPLENSLPPVESLEAA